MGTPSSTQHNELLTLVAIQIPSDFNISQLLLVSQFCSKKECLPSLDLPIVDQALFPNTLPKPYPHSF